MIRLFVITVFAAVAVGCAGTFSPMPGMEFGFDASVEEGAHTTIGINRDETSAYIASGPCYYSKKFGWSWLEFVSCPPSEDEPEADPAPEAPAPAPAP